jgi:hypothetical protein
MPEVPELVLDKKNGFSLVFEILQDIGNPPGRMLIEL